MTRLFGIDVSHWQTVIDWNSIKGVVHFIFVKSSEGSSVDGLFQEHWNSAKAMDIPRGAYHYYRPYLTGKYQATVMAALLAGQWGELPTVLDLEEKSEAGGKAVANSARSFCETLAGLSNRRVMIYTSTSFLFKLRMEGADLRWMSEFSLWQAAYPWELRKDFVQRFSQYQTQVLDQQTAFPAPPYPFKTPADVWQWTGHGRVAGIAGDVDLNVADQLPGIELPANEPEPAAQPVTYKTTATLGLFLREGPGTAFPVIRLLPYGTTVELSTIKGGWGFTGSGWLSMTWVREV